MKTVRSIVNLCPDPGKSCCPVMTTYDDGSIKIEDSDRNEIINLSSDELSVLLDIIKQIK